MYECDAHVVINGMIPLDLMDDCHRHYASEGQESPSRSVKEYAL